MALIGKIRNNFWFVLLLLGFALASFVLMDIIGSKNGASGDQFTMGEVYGNEINYADFNNTENILYRNSGGDVFERRSSLWDYYVTKSIVEKQATDIGMGVSYDELMDLQFGNNLSPIIQQNWKNPQTGQLDRARLLEYKGAIENGQELDPNFRAFWREQEKQIKTYDLQDKLSNLVSKALFTPNWLAEEIYQEQNSLVDMAYVKIPYENIDGTTIELTDADYKSYMEDNKSAFTNVEETRDIQYIAFDVIPTSEDSSKWKSVAKEKLKSFSLAQNDSLFAINNNGVYQDFYFEIEKFPSIGAKDTITKMEEGAVYGPYIEERYYRVAKLIDKRMIPDSVEARHILKSVEAGNITQLKEARKLLDSLKIVLETNQNRFDSLAIKFSDDPGSKTNGGELGTFTQGRMVPTFNEVCFMTGNESGYYIVESQFGVHLIDIQDQIYNNNIPKYKVAFINVDIVPSQATQDSIYEVAAELLESNPYWADLKAAVTPNMGVTVENANSLNSNDYSVGTLGSGDVSRSIVKWAFDMNVSQNDAAPQLYTYTDPLSYYNNKYVAVGLERITSPGMASLASVKDDITQQVINIKKGEMIQEGSDLRSFASKYNTKVDTASGVNFKATFIPNIGNEPMVVGAAFETALNQISKPVVGTEGVYILKPFNSTKAGAATNIPALRRLETLTTKGQTTAKLMESLKKEAEIKDSRSKFY